MLYVEHPKGATTTAKAGPIRATILAGEDPVLTRYSWDPWQKVAWHERRKRRFDKLADTMRALSGSDGGG